MKGEKILIVIISIFLFIVSFSIFQAQSQSVQRYTNVSDLFGFPYSSQNPKIILGECGGDLPKVCKDLGFSLPEGPGKQSGLGVDRTLCLSPNGNISYQYSCDITSVSSIQVVDSIDPVTGIFSNSSVVPVEEIFEKADLFDGIKFINLDNLKKIKAKMARDKDLRDIELIDIYLSSN